MNKKKKKLSGVPLLMRKSKRDLAVLLDRVTRKSDEQLDELLMLREREAEFDAQASRMSFLLARHNALEEWANSARRVVFSFPGVTNE